MIWRWFVDFIRAITGADGKIEVEHGQVESKQAWGERWMAEWNLIARMNHPSKPDIPDLPEDALIVNYGAKPDQKKEQ